MPSPVTPSRVRAIIPAANSSLCTKLVATLIKFPLMYLEETIYKYNEDGTWTDQYKADAGIATGALNAPTNVTATDGDSTTQITITWSSVAGATKYDVYRSETNDTGTASRIASDLTVTSYINKTSTDTTLTVGKTYYYWVKAKNDSGVVSVFSTSDQGYCGTTSEGQSNTFSSDGKWVVPVGVTSIDVVCFGGGGGGGGMMNNTWGLGGYSGAGGGGGGGGRAASTGISVTAGQEIFVTVGKGGVHGALGASGQPGGESHIQITSSGSPTVVAPGGGGGEAGKTQGSAGGAKGSGNNAAGGSAPTNGNGTGGTYGVPGVGGVGGTGCIGQSNSGGNGAFSGAEATDGGGGFVQITIHV